jgi:hypothetical protein
MEAVMKRVLLGGVLALSLATNAADAANVTIGLSTGVNDPITTVAGPNVGTASFSGTSANGFGLIVSGQTNPVLTLPNLFNSNSIEATSPAFGGGTLVVWLTASGITTPISPTEFFASSFTTNVLNNMTATMATWVNPSNGIFATQTPLASQFFDTSNQTAQFFTTANTGNGPYSVTERYVIAAGEGAGNANLTINLSVPGPIVGAGLPGLMAACAALLGLAARRRRQKVA